MKKLIYIFSLFAVLFILTGCGKTDISTSESGRPSVIATTFPEYDWLVNVLGDEAENVDVTLLLQGGTDLHNYQPTVMDMAKIADCNLFIYNGGESDEWVENALTSTNCNAITVNIMEALDECVKIEEVIEGMEAEEGEGPEEEEEYDEHVWLSLKNRQIAVEAISDAMAQLIPEKGDKFSQNASAYCEKLAELDGQYNTVVENSKNDTLIFGDRFPFRYMLEDYGVKYFAAFPGCSTESNASFETVVFLSKKADEVGAKFIMTTENSDCKIANSIVENTAEKSAQILSLDSMQSGIEYGKTYLDIMKDNLDILEKALG